MKTSNSTQLKAKIKNKAKEAGVSPQLMLQNYMLERLIDRISRSAWRDDIIVKGGMLIGSLIGVDKRSTRDLDTTVRNFTLSHESAEKVFREVCTVEIDDDIEFVLDRTEDIREIDKYPGIRVFLKANYDPMSVPLKIDVTTGDKIVPEAIAYDYPFAFDEGSARVFAYPLETVMAEKLETVISRNVGNTRIRDFYDIYELWRIRKDQFDMNGLRDSIRATSEARGSERAIEDYRSIIEAISENEQLSLRWDEYAAANSYASGILFGDTCKTALEIMGLVLQ